MDKAEIQLFPGMENLGMNDEASTTRHKPEIVYERLFPERRFTSFFRRQIRFVFFSILADIITPESVVLDFGAGRGKHVENEYGHMGRLVNFRGRVKKVIGIDPDEAVFANPTLDEALRMDPDGAIPLPDASVDVVVSCAVLEHVSNPKKTASEITRVLKPGGWFCAYTPNKWGYVGICVRMVPNALHARMVKHANPTRRCGKRRIPHSLPHEYTRSHCAPLSRFPERILHLQRTTWLQFRLRHHGAVLVARHVADALSHGTVPVCFRAEEVRGINRLTRSPGMSLTRSSRCCRHAAAIGLAPDGQKLRPQRR